MTGWRKSSFSGTSGCAEIAFVAADCCANNSCVEVAHDGPAVLVRNSRDPFGPRLTFNEHEWECFLAGAKAGEFDLP